MESAFKSQDTDFIVWVIVVMNYWQGANVKLRAIEPEDGAFFFESLSDAFIQKYVSDIRVPMSLKACNDWALNEASKGNDSKAVFLVIEDRDGHPVGMLDTHDIDERVRAFSCGIWIKPQYWRKGYATEAITIVLRFFFEQLGFQKFNTGVHSYNDASIRLNEKLGLKCEGRIRRTVFFDGKYYDEVLYGLTVEEYYEGIGKKH